jgi:hypothetical protein
MWVREVVINKQTDLVRPRPMDPGDRETRKRRHLRRPSEENDRPGEFRSKTNQQKAIHIQIHTQNITIFLSLRKARIQ